MLQTKYSARYLSSRAKFLKNNPELFSKTTKAIALFASNHKHPGLNIEKLKGSKFWTIRIDKGNRIFFTWINKTTALF